ncbi:hypothetical protein BGX28_008258 [Mortierella sp. GBA30]|nr:hypothetical protein BGX28_008258 [Mortierella sp. GBA30]
MLLLLLSTWYRGEVEGEDGAGEGEGEAERETGCDRRCDDDLDDENKEDKELLLCRRSGDCANVVTVKQAEAGGGGSVWESEDNAKEEVEAEEAHERDREGLGVEGETVPGLAEQRAAAGVWTFAEGEGEDEREDCGDFEAIPMKVGVGAVALLAPNILGAASGAVMEDMAEVEVDGCDGAVEDIRMKISSMLE